MNPCLLSQPLVKGLTDTHSEPPFPQTEDTQLPSPGSELTGPNSATLTPWSSPYSHEQTH